MEACFSIIVKTLAGVEYVVEDLKQHTPILEVKSKIQEMEGLAAELQWLVFKRKNLQDTLTLEECNIGSETVVLLIVKDEDFNTEFTTWDTDNSCNPEMLTGSGNILSCPGLTRDYLSVMTKAPLTSGKHYFQFTMHHIADEEWCGVTPLPEQAKDNPYPTGLRGWLYYCGRMGSSYGQCGLQFMSQRSRQVATKVKREGDVIGMAIDLDKRRIVFDLNGVYQGGDSISEEPMWVMTTVDRPEDKIEVNKLPFSSIPDEAKLRLQSGIFVDPPPPPSVDQSQDLSGVPGGAS